jgi:ABC-type amino acid transport substrate-binding protein
MALAALLTLATARPAAADQLTAVQQRGTLRWCAEQEGGGPFVYPKDDDPSQVTGFEVDLAAQLAAYLKVQPEFVQGQWDKLPDMLRTDKCDVVLNGYEPLFATIDPKAADQISTAAIQALQGDSASWATLVDQTGQLTETFAGDGVTRTFVLAQQLSITGTGVAPAGPAAPGWLLLARCTARLMPPRVSK